MHCNVAYYATHIPLSVYSCSYHSIGCNFNVYQQCIGSYIVKYDNIGSNESDSDSESDIGLYINRHAHTKVNVIKTQAKLYMTATVW